MYVDFDGGMTSHDDMDAAGVDLRLERLRGARELRAEKRRLRGQEANAKLGRRDCDDFCSSSNCCRNAVDDVAGCCEQCLSRFGSSIRVLCVVRLVVVVVRSKPRYATAFMCGGGQCV